MRLKYVGSRIGGTAKTFENRSTHMTVGKEYEILDSPVYGFTVINNAHQQTTYGHSSFGVFKDCFYNIDINKYEPIPKVVQRHQTKKRLKHEAECVDVASERRRVAAELASKELETDVIKETVILKHLLTQIEDRGWDVFIRRKVY